MAHEVLGSPGMPIRSMLAALALVSVSASACAQPRGALAAGTMVALVGGTIMVMTNVRDCSSPNASELCGFDQGGDTIKQDAGGVILLGGVALIFAGLIGLSQEHARSAAMTPASPLAPTAPAAPTAPTIPAAPTAP